VANGCDNRTAQRSKGSFPWKFFTYKTGNTSKLASDARCYKFSESANFSSDLCLPSPFFVFGLLPAFPSIAFVSPSDITSSFSYARLYPYMLSTLISGCAESCFAIFFLSYNF
jgi:hypothetical protein